MRRLEQRAMKRRALKDSRDLDPLRADKEERHREQRNCTTPDPLSGEFICQRGFERDIKLIGWRLIINPKRSSV